MIAVSQHSTASAGRLHGSGIWINRGYLVVRDTMVMRFADAVESFAIILGKQSAESGKSFSKELAKMVLGLILCPIN